MSKVRGLALLFLAFANLHAFAQPMANPPFQKILTIVFENTNYSRAIKQPYLARLAQQGALLTNCRAVARPSQGNYIALISGSDYGVNHDRDVTLDAAHIGDLLEAKGRSWRVYAEQYPGNCYLGSRSGDYVRKHVPFLSFQNVQNNRQRCGQIVNADQLETDFVRGQMPDYSLYIPDLQNDGHNTNVAFAAAWLEQRFGPLFEIEEFMKDLLVVITFDEAGFSITNQIYTALFGAMVRPGYEVPQRTNHYSLLRLVEDAWGLGNLGLGDVSAQPLNAIFVQ